MRQTTENRPMLEVENVVHRYGTVTALADVSLSAGRGEFLTILGSSGSGKTTLLRVISGLERPTSVRALRIDGADVAGLPAAKRNCTTVFQSYALFPHMNVVENVAYGLRIRKVNHADACKRHGAPSPWCSWKPRPTDGSASCPAARSSASRWRARW